MGTSKWSTMFLYFFVSAYSVSWSLTLIECQKPPPNYSEDDMPVTSFDCRDKIIGGYYADQESGCQMFHVCVKIPGVGVQDYRFLCPNDTLFDQENQICDDYYNIECEANSLYYGDFDLYRIGADHRETTKKKTVHKGTPIPLGPSSTIKPWLAESSKKPSFGVVNNAVTDEEDEFFLQKSVAAGENVPSDLFRGSGSSNFFSSKNRGQDYLEDYEDNGNVGVNQQRTNKNGNGKKIVKTTVRKFKRPIQAQLQSTKYTSHAENKAQQSYNPTQFNFQPNPTEINKIQRQYNASPSDLQQNPTTAAPNKVHQSDNQRNNYQLNSFDNQNQQFSNQQRNTQQKPIIHIQQNPTDASKIQQSYNQRNNNFADVYSTESNKYTKAYDPRSSFKVPSYSTDNPKYQHVSTVRSLPVSNTFKPAQSRGTVNYNSYLKSQEDYQDEKTQLPEFHQKINLLTENVKLTNVPQSPTKFGSNSNYDNFFKQDAAKKSFGAQIDTKTGGRNFNYEQLSPQYINQNLQDSNSYEKFTSEEVAPKDNQRKVYKWKLTDSSTEIYAPPQAAPSPVSSQPSVQFVHQKKPDLQKTTQFRDEQIYQKFGNNARQNAANDIYNPPTTQLTQAFIQPFSTSQRNIQTTQKSQIISSSSSPLYDPYVAFKKATENYDSFGQDEVLKTAPSSHLKPSDLNSIYKQTYNATLKAAINFQTDKKTQKFEPKTQTFLQQTPSAKTASTFSPPTKSAAILKKDSPYVIKNLTSSSPLPKQAPQDYDYAYYDETHSSEYDSAVGNVGEDFVKLTKNAKKSKNSN